MLTKPIAISVNRGGQSLTTAQQVAEAVGWPVIGVDPRDIVLVDAGSAVVGFGFQITNLRALVEAGTACVPEAEFEQAISTEPTTAATLEFASLSLEEDARKAARHLELDAAVTGRARGDNGRQRLQWTDVNGNLMSFVQFAEAGLKGKRGGYYRQLLERRGFQLGKKGGRLDNPAPLLGVTLLVSDLARSRKFYEGVLGLKVVEEDRDDVTLDAGNIVLRLRLEPSIGLMDRYRQSRMLRDQYSFYTPDIEAEVSNLSKQGVSFGRGIDRSISAGALARFFDPDGHSFWLWQPQPGYVEGMPIDYTPVVNRILKEHDAPRPKEAYRGPVTTTPPPTPPDDQVPAPLRR
jgi:catechol 2,3-dioxygenase-like lactoylglutathione lyase family enzyme